MSITVSWRARLRFRLHKRLRIASNEHQLEIAGRAVVLSPPTPDATIADSEWLIMNARGFASDDEARTFGGRLKDVASTPAGTSRHPPLEGL